MWRTRGLLEFKAINRNRFYGKKHCHANLSSTNIVKNLNDRMQRLNSNMLHTFLYQNIFAVRWPLEIRMQYIQFNGRV